MLQQDCWYCFLWFYEHWFQIQMDHIEMRCGAFEFLRYNQRVSSLQAHSHVRKLLSNAPVESVVRVTGIVSSRPPGQENPVRMLGSLKVFIPLGEEHWTVGLRLFMCVIALPRAVLFCAVCQPILRDCEARITAVTNSLGEVTARYRHPGIKLYPLKG